MEGLLLWNKWKGGNSVGLSSWALEKMVPFLVGFRRHVVSFFLCFLSFFKHPLLFCGGQGVRRGGDVQDKGNLFHAYVVNILCNGYVTCTSCSLIVI